MPFFVPSLAQRAKLVDEMLHVACKRISGWKRSRLLDAHAFAIARRPFEIVPARIVRRYCPWDGLKAPVKGSEISGCSSAGILWVVSIFYAIVTRDKWHELPQTRRAFARYCVRLAATFCDCKHGQFSRQTLRAQRFANLVRISACILNALRVVGNTWDGARKPKRKRQSYFLHLFNL